MKKSRYSESQIVRIFMIYLIGARLLKISSNHLFLDEGLSPRMRGSQVTTVVTFS